MPLRRRLAARVAVSLAWLLAGCKFDAAGLGTDSAPGSESTGSGGSGSSSGEPTTGSDTTTTPGTDTGPADTGSSGDPCAEGCAPAVGWTNVDAAAGHALVLDGKDDAVVAGDRAQDKEDQLRDAWVAKFSAATGERAWESWHDGASRRTDYARAVVILPNGQLLIAGMSQEDPDRRQDVWLGWYSEDGDELTSSNLGTAHWNGDDPELDESARALAVDPAGDLLVGGTRCYNPCEAPDAWIGRFTSEGKPIWDEAMQSPGQGIVRAMVGVGTDLIAAGTDGYDEAPGQWRSLIRRFDSQGGGLWSASQEMPGAVDYDATTVALADDGRLWVVGRELADDAAPARGFIRVYQPDGAFEPLLERRGDDLDGEPRALALFPDGRVVVTGVAGAGSERHLFLAGLDGELAPLWRIDEPADEVTSGRGVARTSDGDLVVLGQLERLDGRPATTWLRRYITAAP